MGKQPAVDFFAESDAQPPAPATMNADFFEDPPAGVPLAPAPADGQDLFVHMEALPPSPVPVMNDSPMVEAMPPAPVSGDVDSGEEQESRVPTWGDYAAQQSVNAQLAEKVAELTKATHLLWREERTLRRRSHHQILKLKKQCQIQPTQIRDEMFPNEEQPVQRNLRQKPVLPVSLTHAATRHHRHRVNSHAVESDSAVGSAMSADEGPLIGANVGSMAGMYNAFGVPSPHGSEDGNQEKSKKRELEDELAASRARLGRNEEARLHLEEQIKELEERYRKGARDKEQRQEDLVAAQKRQRAKEMELEKAKQELHKADPLAAAVGSQLGDNLKRTNDQIEQEKQDLLTYRDQADVKLRARKNEVKNLQAKNLELRKELQVQMAGEQKLQNELKAAQDTWSRLSGQVEALHRDEVEVSQEQQTEEHRLQYENDKLQSEADQERQCMDWGHRLDARLQHELKRKVADAKLCRDSILSLHNERLELKDKSAKYKRELEQEKLRENEARRGYEENQQLLDHCLGQMTR